MVLWGGGTVPCQQGNPVHPAPASQKPRFISSLFLFGYFGVQHHQLASVFFSQVYFSLQSIFLEVYSCFAILARGTTIVPQVSLSAAQ